MNTSRFFLTLTIALVVTNVYSQSSNLTHLTSSVLAGGGGSSSGGGFTLDHTLGEVVLGNSIGSHHTLAAGFWAQEEDSKSCIDFAQGLPAGTIAAGTTPPFVAGGVLHLTDAINNQANYWTTPIAQQRIQSVSAQWKTLIGGGGDPNDGNAGGNGLSFGLGTDLGTSFTPEEGATNGLIVAFDTFANGDFVGVEIKWNGQRVGFIRSGDGLNSASAKAPLRRNEFIDTTLEVTPSGMATFTYAGLSVSAQLPSYSGIEANQYVFAAGTSAALDNHWIDDFCIRLDPSGAVDLVVMAGPANVTVTEGDSFAVEVLVSNRGPSTATNVRLSSTLPMGVSSASLTSSAGACQVEASNIVCTVSSLAPQQSFTVVLTATTSLLPGDLTEEFYDWSDIIWSLTSTTGTDLNPADNQALVAVAVFVKRDFADAPSPPYLTCLPTGARHRVVAGGGYCMGLLIDWEANCQPDDNLFNLADEDGVTFYLAPPWAAGTVVTPTVFVTRPGGMVARVDAWFDGDGFPGFDPADRIYAGLLLPAMGPNVLPPFTVPATAPAGVTWLRFRMSQVGVASPGGYAPDGEVEDYTVTITPATPPTVVLVIPESGASYSIGSVITLSATASAADGKGIATVEFLDRSNRLGQALQSPYTLAVSNLTAGAHVITAKATDSTGLVATSAPAIIQVAGATTNAPGGLDLVFDPGSSISDEAYDVLTIARQADGKIIVGGEFTAVHGAPRGRVARLLPDGSTDFTFGDGLAGADNRVGCVAVQPDGKVIVGGYFLQVNGVAHSKIARLNADGTLDLTFQNGMSGVTGGGLTDVNSIALQPDGRILIAGQFGSVNGVARTDVARLESDGSLDATFQNPVINGEVFSLALQSDGKVIIVGNFNTVGGVARAKVARLNANGSLDTTFQDQMTGADNTVVSVIVQPDGQVLIGGGFSFVNGEPRRMVARLNTNGSIDSSFQNPEIPSVTSLALQSDGKLIVGGAFSYYETNFVGHGGITRLNADGSRDTSFGAGLSGANNPVDAVLLLPNGQILIGGRFSKVNGNPRVRIARLDSAGILDTSFGNGPPGADAIVYAVATQADGKVVIGGAFDFVNYAVRHGIARLNQNGTLDTAFQNNMAGVNATVFSAAVQTDQKVLIAGNFGTVNGVTRRNLARMNSDGSLDTTFPDPGLIGQALGLAVQPDGKIVVVGGFTIVQGIARYRVARLYANGSLDTNFVNAGVSGQINAVALQPDGKIVIGGSFTAINGFTRNRLARLNADGSLDLAFQDGLSGANGLVSAIAVQVDGKLVIGGQFNTVNGIVRNRAARLNSDGSLDDFLNGLTGVNNQVLSLALQSDGKILLGGFFTTVNSVSRNNIARLNTGGSLDTNYLSGASGGNGGVFSIAVTAGGSTLLGGDFTQVNGIARDRVARLYGQTVLHGTTPSFAVFGGLGNVALGSATVSSNGNGLQISNLDLSGQDGLTVGLQELSRTARLRFTPVDLTGVGAGLTFAASGMVNDVPGRFLGKFSLQRNGNATELNYDSGPDPLASTLRVEVYNQGVLAGAVEVQANGVLGTLSGMVQLASVTVGGSNSSASQFWWDLDFLAPITFSPAGLTGDHLRLALIPSFLLQNLMRLDVTGRNLDSVVIEEENAPTFQPRLRTERTGEQLTLKWDTRSAVLQTAPTVNGPWTTVREGTNSTQVQIGGSNQFYRVHTKPMDFCAIGGYVCKRNILLIIADDVGVDQIQKYISYYGNPARPVANRITSNLVQMETVNKLARSGVTFLNAWSSPVCSPTRACLYTGTRSSRHGVYRPVGGEIPGLLLGTKTIANVLKDSGYKSGLFGKWHLGTNTNYRPLEFGWDTFAGSLGGGLASYTSWEKSLYSASVISGDSISGLIITGETRPESNYATWENRDDALVWINARTGPWMATVAFNAPHDPWAYPDSTCVYNTRTDSSDQSKYRSMLECLDRSIGDLLDGIPSAMLEQTTIIFMGDNGTPVSDNGTPMNADDTPISQHFPLGKNKDSVYEGGINVPIVIADGYTYLHPHEESSWTNGLGRVVAPEREETALVGTIDLFATIAEIARGDYSTGLDSVSMVPYLSSNAASSKRDHMFAENHTMTSSWRVCGDSGWDVAIRDAQYKLIVKNYGSMRAAPNDEQYELYDLINDRWEITNLRADGVSTEEDTITGTLLNAIDSLLGSNACTHP